MWSPGPLLPGLQAFKLNAGGSMQQLVSNYQVPQKTTTGSHAAKYAATAAAASAAASGPAGSQQHPVTAQLQGPAASRIPTAPDTTCSTDDASTPGRSKGSTIPSSNGSSSSARAASGQAAPRGRSAGFVSTYPQLAVRKPAVACSSIPASRRRTSGSNSSSSRNSSSSSRNSSSSSTAAQQRTRSEPSGVRGCTGPCVGVSSSCYILTAKAPISCCLPVASVRAMQTETADFICQSLNSSNDGTNPGPSSDIHPGHQQQQQQIRTVHLPPPKQPASPFILAGCTTAAAGRVGSQKKQPPSSSSSSSSSDPPAGLASAPQLLQYLQLPPGVKAMMALPQSHSQQKYRERQRLELYALNTVMARSEKMRRQQQQQHGSV